MFDFIDSLLQKFTSPAVEYRTGYLPSLQITEKMEKEFDLEYLDFILNLFATTQKSNILSDENQLWFGNEVAKALRRSYPNMTLDQYGVILQQIIRKESL